MTWSLGGGVEGNLCYPSSGVDHHLDVGLRLTSQYVYSKYISNTESMAHQCGHFISNRHECN
jgi:hypothetical protein